MEDEHVQRIVNFCRPFGLRNFKLNVLIGRHYHGNALSARHGWIISEGKWFNGVARVWMPRKKHVWSFPCNITTYYETRILILDHEEMVVELIAHELFHIKQTVAVRTGKRISNGFRAKRYNSEKGTVAYSIKMIRKWRRMRNIEREEQAIKSAKYILRK